MLGHSPFGTLERVCLSVWSQKQHGREIIVVPIRVAVAEKDVWKNKLVWVKLTLDSGIMEGAQKF